MLEGVAVSSVLQYVAQPLNGCSSPGKLRPAAKVRGFRLILALLEYTAEAHVRARCKTGPFSIGFHTKQLVGGCLNYSGCKSTGNHQ